MVIVGSLSSPSWGQAQKVDIAGNPIVNGDRVTLRLKVTGENDRPVMTLGEKDFRTIVDGGDVAFEDWKSPEESTPPPAWVVVLLDMSGSMQQLDSRGDVTRQDGAIKAVRAFLKASSERSSNTQVAIVPFGEPGPSCKGYEVDADSITEKFFPAEDLKQERFLEHLESKTPCASTNIYAPLSQAVRLLADRENPNFYPPDDSDRLQPRLSVILLSDGFHTPNNEARDFLALQQLLQKNDNIIVHTLGYGSTPEQLGEEYGLGRPVTRQDVGDADGKVPLEKFVDRDRLAAIAKATGGMAEFSGEARAIAEALQLFLNALLGEYEITYATPDAERGSTHEVYVEVNSLSSQPIQSEFKLYKVGVFGRTLPRSIRIKMMIGSVLGLSLGGMLPFYIWGQQLKNKF